AVSVGGDARRRTKAGPRQSCWIQLRGVSNGLFGWLRVPDLREWSTLGAFESKARRLHSREKGRDPPLRQLMHSVADMYLAANGAGAEHQPESNDARVFRMYLEICHAPVKIRPG